jgi:hypothetical protein
MLGGQNKESPKPLKPNSSATNPQQQLLKHPHKPAYREQKDIPAVLQEINFEIERAPFDR